WTRTHWAEWTHGRPLSWTLWLLIPFLCFKIGNLTAVYVVSSLFVMANGVLFYLLLRRIFGQQFAVIGGLAYFLFPAGTARHLIVHAVMLQSAMTLTLIAMHLYLSRRCWAAYVVAASVLLCYESAFLPFALVPLLVIHKSDWRKRLLIHWGLCFGLLIAA